MEIADIFWLAMRETLRNTVRINLSKYETDNKYTVEKIYDGKELTGFCVYHDDGDFRVLDECHYIGTNKYAALKMWKFMTKGKTNLRIICQKANEKMSRVYQDLGFKIISETDIDFIYERVKPCQVLSAR
jgi:RimJ/RimL family protein N-acetyltransferase